MNSTAATVMPMASGTRMRVPRTPKLGPLRQTAKELIPGRVYFVLFANTGGVVKPGSKVTVVFGGVRIADLPVE